ncbi:MAG: GNAT family N-acetyltransferase [Roseburia sp.]
MPIQGIEQPEYIEIDSELRLHRYAGEHDFAYSWYQDIETVWLVDGVREPYDEEQLKRMYTYLDAHGELYFIEWKEAEGFVPIGDVTFWQEDMPIVIGRKDYRGRGIGKKVVNALVERGRALGYDELHVAEIYSYNTGSRGLFEAVGFVSCEETEKGNRYKLSL